MISWATEHNIGSKTLPFKLSDFATPGTVSIAPVANPPFAVLRLVVVASTSTGVVIATYQQAERTAGKTA